MYVPGIKKSNFVVVPWYNRHEWEKTYQNLFSHSPKDQAAGLSAVAAWRSRLYGHLPRAIESTAALVRAQLSDSRSRLHDDRLNPEELSSLYAVAIVRFVGDIVEPVRGVKNITTKEAAFQLGVPDWILELRHASAHASVSGAASLGVLRSAAFLLLQWLRLHHWEPQRDTLVTTEASAVLRSKNGSDAEHVYCSPTQVRQTLDVWLLVSVKQKRKCTRREMAELKVKQQTCLDQIAVFVEEDSDLVVDMLVMGGDYLLPSRECLDELCPNIRLSLPSSMDGSPCRLPRLLADRWDPLLATLQHHTLQKLAERLLSQPYSTRRSEEDESLRRYLSVAWLGHLLTGRHEQLSRAGNGSDQSSSSAPSQLNVTRLLKAAMDYPMEYSTKAITVLSQHMWPQLSEAELGHLTALAAIQGGLMVGRRWDTTDGAEEETGGDGNYMPYTVEDFQGSEDGFDEPAWKLPQTPMEWSVTPVGQLPGFPADRLDLNLDFKELRPVGVARLEEAGLGLDQGGAEASVNTEDTELPALADQLQHISQNVQLFVV
uniref:Protein containing Las1 domain n=1 Tax=Rhipicephalus zambeziensis TaxID=60191 RepID=A0A224YYM2_9ACAR